MARLGGLERDLDGLGVAHFADHDHIGILPQRRAQGLREAARVGADLALGDAREPVLVEELDGILDGQDMRARGLVDLPHDGSERR